MYVMSVTVNDIPAVLRWLFLYYCLGVFCRKEGG